VAINDSKYIDGLIENGFNLSDIKRIRRLDRKCQGVSKEEEAAKKVNLDNRIIEFNYEHFSPLNDRIYFEKGWKKYIIFNDKLTMFYGFDTEKLKKFLKENGIESCFYGGGREAF
jgi:predicted metallo-beta-lactamase superfamily hydrolase